MKSRKRSGCFPALTASWPASPSPRRCQSGKVPRVKPGSRYFVHKQGIENASSAELLEALADAKASNVEIRKSSAATGSVEVSKYYRAVSDASLLEVPRDSLGRLWDRLEENAITSFLFHALTRWLAWHVEMFFTPEEFATFWATHAAIPIKKIQVRFIQQDGLPCSPFRDHDCISVDMFLMRWHRTRFEAYLLQTFPVIRANPGKHSR